MSEAALSTLPPAPAQPLAVPSPEWLAAARRARALSWAQLGLDGR